MQKTITVCAVALILSALGAVPARAQNREHQQMTAELRMLQEQTQQLALSLAQIADAIKALNSRLDTSDQAAQKRFADQELLIKNLTSELSTIRERTQDTDTRLRSLSDEIGALRSTVTSLPNLLTSGGATSPAGESSSASTASPGGVTSTPPSSTGSSSSLGLSPSRMLESARSDYFSGSYASAITGFEALVKAFPTSEAAAEAYYYLGETYYTQKRNQDAVSAYTRVIQSYPKSNWVPDAYFKRGRALEALGQVDEARASYEQLIKSFAGSAPAGLARQRLDALRRQSSTTAKP
ncbi:MAG TPA: tol-pal system protein YbgF [Vicinamibacterales bacterium]|jgi:tol-pal system protein YbgF